MSKSIVVSGYATIDYVAHVAQPLHGPGTRAAVALCKQRWPNPGGAAFYASVRIAAAGHRAYPLVTLGEDSNGVLYSEACSAANVSTTGIQRIQMARTPWCLLLYHDDGGYTCLLDTGAGYRPTLNEEQRALIAAADFVCIAAAPVATTWQVLSLARAEQPLAWIVKDDPSCFPADVCQALAHRAHIIFCNSRERGLIDAARSHLGHSNQIIVETCGEKGVLIERDRRVTRLSCEPVNVGDTTGAGDTLAGEVLATLVAGEENIEAAVRRGMDATRALLLSRDGAT